MSRIGNRVISIPSDVTVTLDGNKVTVKGPKGELTNEFNSLITINVEDNKLTCKRANDELFTKSIHGTTNALIENMIVGVSKGYTVELETVGVGYRFQVTGKQINVSAGFSHPVIVDIPEGITVESPSNTELKISEIGRASCRERVYVLV